jgi:hypothetical protein
MEINNLEKLELNKAYEAKLSWKRKENLELRTQIKEFIETNFDILMPSSLKKFKLWVKKHSKQHETYNFISEEYGQLIKAYYILGFFGQSVASLFENGKGHFSTYTNGHLYSKHRLDPVWNWKKSKIIRSAYLKFFKDNPHIMEQYTPVHITLTLPHPDGKYKGEEFYAKQLIDKFNFLRKGSLWQKSVYAGEYGIEVSSSKSGNGLHIHLHSLVFLKCKQINAFREKLQKLWQI